MATVVVGHLHAKDKTTQRKIIDELSKVLAYSESQEPGVTKYALCVSREPSDDLSVFAIEEYADQSALDGHMSSAAVQNLIKVFTEQGASLFAAPTDVYANNSMFSMAKPKLNQSPNPYIVFAQIKFKEGTKAQGLDGLKDVIKSARNDETSTLAYNVLEDKEDLHKLRIVSAYDSETAYRNEHLQAIAVKENEQRNKPNWENLTFWPLKLVAGYMHKGRLPNHSGL